MISWIQWPLTVSLSHERCSCTTQRQVSCIMEPPIPRRQAELSRGRKGGFLNDSIPRSGAPVCYKYTCVALPMRAATSLSTLLLSCQLGELEQPAVFSSGQVTLPSRNWNHRKQRAIYSSVKQHVCLFIRCIYVRLNVRPLFQCFVFCCWSGGVNGLWPVFSFAYLVDIGLL